MFCIFNEIIILGVYLDKFNIDYDNHFYEDYPDTTNHVNFLALPSKFEKCKAIEKKIDKKLMPVTQHPTRWWIDSC